jgi:hypothetical protein
MLWRSRPIVKHQGIVVQNTRLERLSLCISMD